MRTTNVVVESIAFQSHKLADGLTQLFEELIQTASNPKAAQAHPACKAIVKLIAEETGVNMSLTLDTNIPPSVRVPILKKDHQLMDTWVRGLLSDDYNQILKSAEKNKTDGWIDLKNAKLGGIFQTIQSPIAMGWNHVKSLKLTGEECAALLVHEVGHIFTFYEYLSRAITTNQVLAAVHKSLLENKLNDEHKIVLKRAGSVVGDPDAFVELNEVKDSKVVTTVIIRKGLSEPRSELGSGHYDVTSAEQLADQFAARFGLGRAAVTGLDKIHKAYGFPENSGAVRTLGYISQVINIFCIGLTAVVGAMTGNVLLIAMAAVAGFGSAWAAGDGVRDRTYDDTRVRFSRIREQYIHSLKSTNNTPAEIKEVIEDIEQMDKVIKQLVEYKNIFNIVGNFLFSSNREAVRIEALQRTLEELAANDIFLRAKQLSIVN